MKTLFVLCLCALVATVFCRETLNHGINPKNKLCYDITRDVYPPPNTKMMGQRVITSICCTASNIFKEWPIGTKFPGLDANRNRNFNDRQLLVNFRKFISPHMCKMSSAFSQFSP